MRVLAILLTVVGVGLGLSSAMAEDGSIEPFGPGWYVAQNQPCQVWYDTPRSEVSDLDVDITWSGACIDGKASGLGRLVVQIGAITSVYDGDMEAGKSHGWGTMNSGDRGRYEGMWRDGQPNGQGTFISPDGRRYKGGWRNGQPYGLGTLTLPDGEVQSCEWDEDGRPTDCIEL